MDEEKKETEGQTSQQSQSPPARKNVTPGEIMAMRVAGMSFAEIARKTGKSKQTIRNNVLKVLKLINEKGLDEYMKNKSRIFNAAEMKILSEMVKEKKLKKANLQGLAFAFSKIYEANRLEQGLSTQNIIYADIQQEKEKIDKAIKEYLEAKKRGAIIIDCPPDSSDGQD